MNLRIPDNFLGRKVEGAMERVLAGSKTQATQPAVPLSPITQNSDEFWRIPQVEYRNGIYVVDLSKRLLDNGNAKTQDDWAKYSAEAKPRGDFYVGDMPLYFSGLSSFSKATGKEAEEAREFLKAQMRAKWLMTLTRVKYQPTGNDKVIHNFGTNEQYEAQAKFVGADEWIKNSKDTGYLEALLGTRDVQKINQVFQAINGTDAYIWRVNSKPKQVDERVAWFLAGSGRAGLVCGWDPTYAGSSLGVRIVREAPQKT